MRILLQPALILHQRAYRDTSLLLDVFTSEYGRIALVARGVRTGKSRLRSILQPFVPLLLSFQGRNELKNLLAAEASGLPFQLKGNCLLSGFYLNELLIRSLQKEDPYPNLYRIYQHTLSQLQIHPLDEKILRLFEKKLLEQLGYALQLEKDFATKEMILENEFYHFYPEQGFTRNPDSELGGFQGKILLALANEQFETHESLREMKRLMRTAFASLLGFDTLESRKLFR